MSTQQIAWGWAKKIANYLRTRYFLSVMQIFDCESDFATARIVYLPVPWEATASYKRGLANGPQAIYRASPQLDLDDPEVERPYQHGLFLLEESAEIRRLNNKAVMLVDEFRQDFKNPSLVKNVNALSDELNNWVYKQTNSLLAQKKIVGVIGGDHSVPYGAIRATTEKNAAFGILHFDAHHDLRQAYQGFTHSHASIMHNVLSDFPQVTRLTQVGIRDYCAEEKDFALSQKKRVSVFYDHDIKQRQMQGVSWHSITKDIVSTLPKNVYVSFDIDGLDPSLCPNTGTPVLGGLQFHEANHILCEVVRSGRQIIGFDLVEVAPSKDPNNEWDGNVGMRLLYKLSAWTLASQGLAKILP